MTEGAQHFGWADVMIFVTYAYVLGLVMGSRISSRKR